MSTRETVILIPGLLCDVTVWKAQCAALEPIAQVHVADLGDRASIGEMADHVLQIAEGPLAIVGHSMGGRVALEVVNRAPERVNRLALLDTGYQPLAEGEAGDRERAGRMALLALAREEGMREMGRQWAPGMVHADRLDGPVFNAILDMIERSTPARFEAQIHALLNRPDATSLLGRIACPTLLLCGRQDHWSPPSRHQEMSAQMHGARLHLVEHCGHMSTMEQPDQVSAALLDWLQQPHV